MSLGRTTIKALCCGVIGVVVLISAFPAQAQDADSPKGVTSREKVPEEVLDFFLQTQPVEKKFATQQPKGAVLKAEQRGKIYHFWLQGKRDKHTVPDEDSAPIDLPLPQLELP